MSGHGHGHGLAGASDDRRRLRLVLTITAAILVVEVIGAVVSGSLALLADAGHMLTDPAGLLIALIAVSLAARPATTARTWGYRRAGVLAATVQAAVLLAVGVFVLVEGIRRLLTPAEVASTAMVVFGVVGLAGNLVSMLVLTRGTGGNVTHLDKLRARRQHRGGAPAHSSPRGPAGRPAPWPRRATTSVTRPTHRNHPRMSRRGDAWRTAGPGQRLR